MQLLKKISNLIQKFLRRPRKESSAILKSKTPTFYIILMFLIGYVLKVAILDASQSGDVGTKILGLLVGGAVCFVVSFTYSKYPLFIFLRFCISSDKPQNG